MTQADIDAAVKTVYGASVVAPTEATPDTPQAQMNANETLTAEATLLNNAIKANYLTAFGNWAALVRAGKIPEQDPPQPPNGLTAVQASNGWTFIIPDVQAVTTMPPLPVVTTTPTTLVVAIGQHLVGNFWAALPTNNIPVGTPMPVVSTASDGTTGSWNWDADPWGGWWEHVS